MRIQLIKELSKSIKMAMMAALMFYIMGPLYAKSLDKNKPLAEQLNKEYEIYEIKHNFDLDVPWFLEREEFCVMGR